MVTGSQTQTEWAPWISDLGETLEPYLVEVKHQGELKLWHSEPLACGSLLHAMTHWENRWVATSMQPPATSSKCAWETFGRPNRWAPSIMGYPLATPGINQHNLPGQNDSPPKKNWIKKWNWKLESSGGGRGCCKHTREAGGQRAELAPDPSANKRQEGQQCGGECDSPWASIVIHLYNVVEQPENHHSTLTTEASWQITDLALAPGKGDEATTQDPSKQGQRQANSKTGQLVDCRAATPQCGRSWPNSSCWKKKIPTEQPPGKTKTEHLFKYQHQDWILEE
jgi:hypothetical protein